MRAADLPEHLVDAGEWKAWPRELEAAPLWGLRQRQIQAYVRNGKLKVYLCPDGSRRLEPDALRELFGEPGIVQGRDRDISAAERKIRQAEAAVSGVDPIVMMFGKSVGMMSDLHTQLLGQLKLVSDPLKVLLDANAQTIAAQAKRIVDLEAQVDSANKARSELLDAQQERDIILKRYEASERRRDETLALLKDQLPSLMKLWLDGDSLSGFGKRVPREVIQAVVESEAISEHDATILRRAAGIPQPAPEQQTSVNGVSSHGH